MKKKELVGILGATAVVLGALTFGGVKAPSGAATPAVNNPTFTWTVSATRWTVGAGDPVTFTFTVIPTQGKTYQTNTMSAGVSNSFGAPGVYADCTIGQTSTDQVIDEPPDGTTSCEMPDFTNTGTHYQYYETVYPKAAGNVQGRACFNYFTSPTSTTELSTCSSTLTVHAVTGNGFAQYPETWVPEN